MTKYWTNKHHLSTVVFQSLNAQVIRSNDCDGRGWIRASDVVINKLDLPRDFQIFITGSYGVGKSTVAEEIMNRTNIQLIQKTDVIKYALRGFIGKRNANLAERKKSRVGSGFNMQDMDAILDEFLTDDKLVERMIYDCDKEQFKNQCSFLLESIARIGDDLARRKIPSIIDGINFPVEILTEHSKKNRMFINLYVDDITILSNRLKDSYDSRMDPASTQRNVDIRKNSMEIINIYFKSEYDEFIKKNNEPLNVLNIKTDNLDVGQVAYKIINKLKKYVYP
jgi:adenylate kinase family enzyme